MNRGNQQATYTSGYRHAIRDPISLFVYVHTHPSPIQLTICVTPPSLGSISNPSIRPQVKHPTIACENSCKPTVKSYYCRCEQLFTIPIDQPDK